MVQDYPKIRVYRYMRPRRRASYWLYVGSTTWAANKEEALKLYFDCYGVENPEDYRAEFAATHGYSIED